MKYVTLTGHNAELEPGVNLALEEYSKCAGSKNSFKWIWDWLSETNRMLIVTEPTNPIVVGFVVYTVAPEADTIFIRYLWVANKKRRLGIGTTLMEKACKELTGGDISIHLETEYYNLVAAAFYKRLGFSPEMITFTKTANNFSIME